MIDIIINVEPAEEVVIVNTTNNYIYAKSVPYKGLVEKAVASIITEDISVWTAMEREFVNTVNKNIFVLTVMAVGCVCKICSNILLPDCINN